MTQKMLNILKKKFKYLDWCDQWYATVTQIEKLFLLKKGIHLKYEEDRKIELKYVEENVKKGINYSTNFYIENTKFNREFLDKLVVVKNFQNKK